jgi:hypothetical protein
VERVKRTEEMGDRRRGIGRLAYRDSSLNTEKIM